MFVSGDERSVRRGRRVAPRTPVCRPCLIWDQETPEIQIQGVVLDLNPHGMMVRSLHVFPLETEVLVQLMRDDEFKVPLSGTIELKVMRHESAVAGFVDHGLKRILRKIQRSPLGKVVIPRRKPVVKSNQGTRMHLADDIDTRRTRR
jgi:hypothetical protein